MDLGYVSPFQCFVYWMTESRQLRQSAVFETTFAALIVGHLGGSSGGKKLKRKKSHSQGFFFGLIEC